MIHVHERENNIQWYNVKVKHYDLSLVQLCKLIIDGTIHSDNIVKVEVDLPIYTKKEDQNELITRTNMPVL